MENRLDVPLRVEGQVPVDSENPRSRTGSQILASRSLCVPLLTTCPLKPCVDPLLRFQTPNETRRRNVWRSGCPTRSTLAFSSGSPSTFDSIARTPVLTRIVLTD